MEEIKSFIKEITKSRWGLISDAGACCIADPGSDLVKLARENNVLVKVINGPSSVFLSLMLSGLNAQKFAFQGYLPRKEKLLIKKIKFLEYESFKQKITQIFIEVPYRSDKILKILMKNLKKETLLSVAINLTSESEKIVTKKIKEFQRFDLKIGKNPSIFLIQAY
jgi:16S rRNA (cytidine1402-2'-O)-methyltransferase